MTISRRHLLGAAIGFPTAAAIPRAPARAQEPSRFGFPIGWPDRPPGDGFLIRHGYATENTWYNPGWWHTGEDWYALEGDTAGARIYAVADGEVAFAGSEYPGLVVVVRHADDLYSMYGHLEYDLAVETGQPVGRGQPLGSVLARSDGRAPSHVHVEVRTFLTTPEVNGEAPRYGYGCGYQCVPGPGYWSIDAPEHPSDMGWRNPTHAIAARLYDGPPPAGTEAIVADGAPDATSLWSLPSDRAGAERLGDLPLSPRDRFPLRSIATGREATRATSAEGYRLWYRLSLPDGSAGWVQAATPSDADTGSDGRPSSIRFDLLPSFDNQP